MKGLASPVSYVLFYQKTDKEVTIHIPCMIHREIAHSPTCAHQPQETCLTLGTIIRCCTISVWQMEAILVKTSSLAESLHTRFNRVLVCCFVSSFLRHSSVMYGAETLPSSYIQQRVNLSECSATGTYPAITYHFTPF